MAMAGLFSQSQLPALPSHKCFSLSLTPGLGLSRLRPPSQSVTRLPPLLTPSVLHQSWEVRCHEACHVTIIQSLTQNIRYYQFVRLFWQSINIKEMEIFLFKKTQSFRLISGIPYYFSIYIFKTRKTKIKIRILALNTKHTKERTWIVVL